MNNYLLELVQKYRNKGLLIDTNLILLYIVGSFDISLIRHFSRTSAFTESDFERVSKFVDYFNVKITTPHIVTEVSNLIGRRVELKQFLSAFIETSNEVFQESIKICKHDIFFNFGLTDAAIAETAKDSYIVLTDDGRLVDFLIRSKIDAVSLEDIRRI